MIPRSGGQYVFSRYALGEYAGFVVGWSDWISTCGTTAAVSIVIGEFSAALLPALAAVAPARSRRPSSSSFALRSGAASGGAACIQNVTSLAQGAGVRRSARRGVRARRATRHRRTPARTPPARPGAGDGVRAVAAGDHLHLRRLDRRRSTSREEVEDPGRDIPRRCSAACCRSSPSICWSTWRSLRAAGVANRRRRVRRRRGGRRDLRRLRRACCSAS